MPARFNCGHPFTPENSVSSGSGRIPRCRQCRHAYRERRRQELLVERELRRRRAAVDRSDDRELLVERELRRRCTKQVKHATVCSAETVRADPVFATSLQEQARMERASRSFLRALYQAHPYVFEAARAAGRTAVIL
ncbi:MAG: hypothetical protein VX309_07875 [Pseudomonadota bacterium]|nr:hypothetical protein [Pseudomonadota bacterium]MEE3155427.1 hypothetical protein [Pseudomonadota bacterium]